jgi:vitamin B12/bleomycin/antimicrobial peptide transport system ATP-binding/permease protein
MVSSYASQVLCHQPALAVLDEATSAVGGEAEAQLYLLLRQAGVAVLTVGQQPSLRGLHDRLLRLSGDGSGAWQLEALQAPS